MNIKADTYLLEHDINPSYQRLKIMEFLLNEINHPTIDMIYNDLKKEMPKLSKTTIYNTLKLFAEKNVVKPLYIEENTVRYDVKTKLHGHFKCIKCGKIMDFDLDFNYLDVDLLRNIEITEHHIYFKGKCKKCIL